MNYEEPEDEGMFGIVGELVGDLLKVAAVLAVFVLIYTVFTWR